MELDTLCESCGDALMAEDAKKCKHCDLEDLCKTCLRPSEHDCPYDPVVVSVPSPDDVLTDEWDDDDDTDV